MPELVKGSNLESNFLRSWEGWDELGVASLIFYRAILRPEAFPESFVICNNMDAYYNVHMDSESNIIVVERCNDNADVGTFKMNITLESLTTNHE